MHLVISTLLFSPFSIFSHTLCTTFKQFEPCLQSFSVCKSMIVACSSIDQCDTFIRKSLLGSQYIKCLLCSQRSLIEMKQTLMHVNSWMVSVWTKKKRKLTRLVKLALAAVDGLPGGGSSDEEQQSSSSSSSSDEGEDVDGPTDI